MIAENKDAARIFLSYRRDDVPYAADRIARLLRSRFGRDCVFLDIESIPPGDDWRTALKNTLQTCDASLVIIGPNWVAPVQAEDGEQDILAIEIATALERKIPLIPVLVDGASMPAADSLPTELRGLCRRQAARIHRDHFDAEAVILLDSLQSRVALIGSGLSRFVAFLIDLILVGLLAVWLGNALVESPWIFLAVFAIWHGLFVVAIDRTPGKIAMGLFMELPQEGADRRILALLRPTVGYAITLSPIGPIQLLFHPQHVALHDRLFQTKVLRTRTLPAWAQVVDDIGQTVNLQARLALVRMGAVGWLISELVAVHFGVGKLLAWVTVCLRGLARAVSRIVSGPGATADERTVTDAVSADRGSSNIPAQVKTALAWMGNVVAGNNPTIVTSAVLAFGSVVTYETLAPRSLSLLQLWPTEKTANTLSIVEVQPQAIVSDGAFFDLVITRGGNVALPLTAIVGRVVEPGKPQPAPSEFKFSERAQLTLKQPSPLEPGALEYVIILRDANGNESEPFRHTVVVRPHPLAIVDVQPKAIVSGGAIHDLVITWEGNVTLPLTAIVRRVVDPGKPQPTPSEVRFSDRAELILQQPSTKEPDVLEYEITLRDTDGNESEPFHHSVVALRAVPPPQAVMTLLRWEQNPRDLDSHAVREDGHVKFNNKNVNGLQLDVDDEDGYGPEVITAQPGVDFLYFVHHYAGDGSIARSGATVTIYREGKIDRVMRPPDEPGKYWSVFRVDKTGLLEEVRKTTDIEPSYKR